MTQPTGSKICRICGEDCSDRPRIKDPQGRYYCKTCHEQAKRNRTPHQIPPPQPDEPGGLLAELIDDLSPPPVSMQSCAYCGQPMTGDAIICLSCGYNAQTGRQLAKVSTKPKRDWTGSAGGLTSAIASPVGAALAAFIFFGLFYLVAMTSEEVAVAYVLVESLFSLAVGVLVLVFAFRESIATGFLTLCVPCYALYFVFAVCENQFVKWLFVLSILTSIAGLFLNLPPGFDEFEYFPS